MKTAGLDRTPSFFGRAKSDSVSSSSTLASFTGFSGGGGKSDSPILPGAGSGFEKPRFRLRALLGHCHYRRVIIWMFTVILLASVTIASRRAHRQGGSLLDLFRGGRTDQRDDEPSASTEETEDKGPHWIKYPHMDNYYTGLRTLVDISEHKPEFPLVDGQAPAATTTTLSKLPTPTPFVPQPDYESEEYKAKYHPVKPCYIDKQGKVPVPDMFAYNGVPQGQPLPALGAFDVVGLRDDVCFDRFGRYGPYGLGYDASEGGTSEGMDTESGGSEAVWARTGRIDYRGVDWGNAQERCVAANKERFTTADELDAREEDLENQESEDSRDKKKGGKSSKDKLQKIDRIAVVVRTYVGFEWTPHAVLNFRAMISELSLRSGGEYTVHFLLHVKDESLPIWADGETAQRVLDENVPAEFHNICTLWSESQMRLLYPGDFGEAVENPSGQGIHGVYRSAHMPLQHFAMTHPEYAHFWNWELDMRYTGSYYELFDRLGDFARRQSRTLLWERSARYYIPTVHGSWSNFSDHVAATVRAAGERPIMGPVLFPGRERIRAEERGVSFLPSTCRRPRVAQTRPSTKDDKQQQVANGYPDTCGVGEEADLITLNPLFDTEESGWVFASDVTGYDRERPTPPRRCAIVTASRLSRRLLAVMHEENWRLHHSMFSEMFPASAALHHGLKAVYAPHPIFLDREWDMNAADANFNGGRHGSTNNHGSPFDFTREHNHKGTSWYYNSEFAGLLWRRWLGYAQMDGRGPNGGRHGEGTLRGGKYAEESPWSTGRLCLRSMLVHPIKFEKPDDYR